MAKIEIGSFMLISQTDSSTNNVIVANPFDVGGRRGGNAVMAHGEFGGYVGDLILATPREARNAANLATTDYPTYGSTMTIALAYSPNGLKTNAPTQPSMIANAPEWAHGRGKTVDWVRSNSEANVRKIASGQQGRALLYLPRTIIYPTVANPVVIDLTKVEVRWNAAYKGVKPTSYTLTAEDALKLMQSIGAMHRKRHADFFNVDIDGSEPELVGDQYYMKTGLAITMLGTYQAAHRVSITIDSETGKMAASFAPPEQSSGSSSDGMEPIEQEAKDATYEAALADKVRYDDFLVAALYQMEIGVFDYDSVTPYLSRPVSTVHPALVNLHRELLDNWWSAYLPMITQLRTKAYISQDPAEAHRLSGSELPLAEWLDAQKATVASNIEADKVDDSLWEKVTDKASSLGGKVVDYATSYSPTEWVKTAAGIVAVKEGSDLLSNTPDWLKWVALGTVAVLVIN